MSGLRPPDQLLLPWSPRYTVSVSRVMEILDVSQQTVLRMIEDGTLKAYKVRPGKTSSPWRVSYDSLLKYLDDLHGTNGLEKRF